MLPDKLPQIPGYEWAAFSRPSREVGGDYYDFFWIDERRLAVLIADVSGKGIPAALMMTMARSLIRLEARQGLSPRETLVRANRHIGHDIKKGMFITALYLVLEVDTRRVHLVSAGHNPLLLWRARTRSLHPVRPQGIALGMDRGPLFERTLREGVITLEPGDRVVLYTDGVSESVNPQGEFFGEQRFNRFVAENSGNSANQFVNLLARTLDDFRGASPQRDDITVVLFGTHRT